MTSTETNRDEDQDTGPDLDFSAVAARFEELTGRIEAEIRRRILGQDQVVQDILTTLVCGGHVLVEGVPGLGKTEMLKTLAASIEASFSRIQFTPDLMPADVVGTQVLRTDAAGQRTFEFREGPVFTNLLLADEINRATPKSQSALLEAMQERQVTVGGETRQLPAPFMVLATQNPIELEGTYPLPEAQLDRFFMKTIVESPSSQLLAEVLRKTTGPQPEEPAAVCSPDDLEWLTSVVREVPIADYLLAYAADLVTATHPGEATSSELVQRYVRTGASPRGGQAIVLAAKARALSRGRPHVGAADIQAVVLATLRHRLILGFEATTEGVSADDVIVDVLRTTAEPEQQGRAT